MRSLRLAVVGCGYWAPNIVRNLVAMKGVEVCVLCDTQEARARELADRMAPGAAVSADHQRLCEDPNIDAACIVTPIRTHFELARDFLLAGKHVFVEKPLAATVAECAELIRIGDANGRILMVGQVFEYSAAVIRIKEYLKAGELGRLLYIYSQRVNLGRIQNDINSLWSFAPHDLSILNYWTDSEPVAVSAHGFRCLGQRVEDVVFVMLEYPGNIGVHLHLGWLDPRKVRQMTLVGSKKMLVYDDVSIDARIQIYDKGVNKLHEYIQAPDSFAEFQYQTRTGDVIIPQIKFAEPLYDECLHFVECVRAGKQPRTDGYSGLRVVKILEAAQESLANGGVVVKIDAVNVSATAPGIASL